jgi:hypothetical protein
LEIDPKAVQRLVSELRTTFVGLERVSLTRVARGVAVSVVGAPWELRRKFEADRRFGVRALPFLTEVIEQQSSGRAEHDLYIGYPREMMTEEGPRPLPKAPGLSGSGVWSLGPPMNEIWSPDSARLVALQRSWLEYEYLRCTLIRDWLTMVREDIPELAPEIDPDTGRLGSRELRAHEPDASTRPVHTVPGELVPLYLERSAVEPPPLPWTVFYAASRLDFNFNSNSIGLT